MAADVNKYLKKQEIIHQTTRQKGKRVLLSQMMKCHLPLICDPTEAVNATPYEQWHGKKPSLRLIQVFDSKLYAPKEKRTKENHRCEERVESEHSQPIAYSDERGKKMKIAFKHQIFVSPPLISNKVWASKEDLTFISHPKFNSKLAPEGETDTPQPR